MTDDPRCCGSGTCIIDPSGRCWCGQQWDGQAMRAPRHPEPTDQPAAGACAAAPQPPQTTA